MTRGLRLLAVASLGFVLGAPRSAPGIVIEGVSVPERVLVAGVELSLRGAGLLRFGYLVKLYVGALYAPASIPGEGVLGEVPRRLEIEYFRPIEAEIFRVSTERGIAANVDAPTLARLEPAIERMNALYRDVEPGDRYALTYVPGVGTELALNGVRLGSVPGADFARAMVSIWIGENALDPGFRAELLGDR
jgi:hypothetical protein